MSSAPIHHLFPDQLQAKELPNGTLARTMHPREVRDLQWATMTGFGGTPLSFSCNITNDTHIIKVLAPPYVQYAWPGILAAGGTYGEGHEVKFTTAVDSVGSYLTVLTPQIGTNMGTGMDDAVFACASGKDIGATKTASYGASGIFPDNAWLKVLGTNTATWRDFKLTVEVPSVVTVYQIFLFWYHQVVS